MEPDQAVKIEEIDKSFPPASILSSALKSEKTKSTGDNDGKSDSPKVPPKTKHFNLANEDAEQLRDEKEIALVPENDGALSIVPKSTPSMSEVYTNPHKSGSGTSPRDSSFFPPLENATPSVLRLQTLDPEKIESETLIQEQTLERTSIVRRSMAANEAAHNVGLMTNVDDPDELVRHTGSIHKFAWPPIKLLGAHLESTNSLTASRKKFSIRRMPDDDDDAKAVRDKTFREDWDIVTSVRANDVHPVTKYRSKTTGFEIVHAQIVSPNVHAYFVIGTKCSNDYGLPHILEHMTFLGSRNFPYPHVLEKLSSKCFASGTNAWTDADHACYTMVTAGKEGFLTLLPVYLDHIFCPILADASYVTEVHHIREDGTDGGVVYTEMEAIEHDPLEKANWALLRRIYTPESGYYYNYGGHCKDMRESCSIGAVKEFHSQFYHPKNACLIICGDMHRSEFFDVINPFFESEIDARSIPENWEKPWLFEPLVELDFDKAITVSVPSEHEGHVLVKIGIIGPPITDDITKSVAMHILFQHLLDSPVGPIYMEFVERDNALSSQVHLTEITHTQKIYCLNFESVVEKDMHQIPLLLRTVLERQINGEFDSDRMELIVDRCYQRELSAMENATEETIAHAVIQDFLYEPKDDGLMFDRRINMAYTIKQFLEQPQEYWKSVIQFILDSNWATVYAVPSKAAASAHAKDEETRVAKMKEKLGDVGGNKMKARIRAATKIQNRPPPREIIDSVQPPSVSSIGFLGIERHENPPWAGDTLCNVYLDDINSSYVYLTVLMDTWELSLEEKKYLALFAEAIFESPYVDDAENFFTVEQTIAGLNRDVLKYESFFGVDWDGREGTRFSCGSYSHLFCIRFQIEMKKVKEGFEWMQILLWNTKWQAGRLKIIAQRLANDVTHLLDNGSTMANAMLTDILFQSGSNVKTLGLIRQQIFLQKIANDLPKSFKKVAKMLEAIRMCILRPENTTVHVATNLPKMEFYLTEKPEVKDAIAQLLRRTFDYSGWQWGYTTKRLANTPDHKRMKGVQCIDKCAVERILRMHSDEGSYLSQAAPCIQDFTHPEYPLVLATIQYFCQIDGPFFRAVKGAGYAKDFKMKLKPNEGMLYFELKSCTNLVAAYCGVFDIVVAHLQQNFEKWDELLLETAKSSVIFEIIEQGNTPVSLAMQSLVDYYHGVPFEFRGEVMEKITEVTLDDVKRMTKKYFRPLFVEVASCAVAAPSEQVPYIIQGLMDHCAKRLSLLPPVHQSAMAAFI